jgi:hypothetical protein
VNPSTAEPRDEVAGLTWLAVADVDVGELAFPSVRRGVEVLRAGRSLLE